MGTLLKYQPYPAYRPSGVEWLGEIPAHWEIKRLKYVAALNPSASEARKLKPDTEVSFVPMESVGEYGGLDLSVTKEISDVAGGYTYFGDGDVLIAKITPCFENGKGSLAEGLINGVAFGTTELHVLRCEPGFDKRFALYLTLTDAFRKLGEAEMYGAGGQKRVPELFVTNLKHPIPPLPEQRGIAAFLDRETARIDALVARKERLIELLQEKRTALITRAVTRGLDPDAPLKDSGVEWLGEIPAHWEVKPIHSLARSGYKTFTDGDWIETPYIRDSGVRLIQTGNIGVGNYKEQGYRYIDDQTFNSFRCTEVIPGDVLICRLADPVGRACLAPNLGCRMITSVDVCIMKTADEINSAFVVYTLSADTYLAWLSAICRGGTRDRVSRSMLGAIRVAIPPLMEQQAIAASLDQETAKLDSLVARVREAIERLRELRGALISAAVTGRIDVREEAGCK